MSRTMFQLGCANSQAANSMICSILTSNGYRYILKNNEYIWKRGGFWTAGKYIKIEFANPNTIVVSAWIKPFGFGEMQIDNSFVGVVPKQQLKSVLDQLVYNVR